jgi:hypothetical protein
MRTVSHGSASRQPDMGKAPYEAGLPRSTSANSVVETRNRLQVTQVTQVTQINTVGFLGVLGGVDHPFRHQLKRRWRCQNNW